MKEICSNYGFEGLFPLDKEIKEYSSNNDLAEKIFNNNIHLIKQSDIIIANLNNFRGSEPDSGTSFECGVGFALDKKLYGYVDSMEDIIKKYDKKHEVYIFESKQYLDENNMFIEDFDLPLNLMLSIPMTIIQGNFEDTVKEVQLKHNPKNPCKYCGKNTFYNTYYSGFMCTNCLSDGFSMM